MENKSANILIVLILIIIIGLVGLYIYKGSGQGYYASGDPDRTIYLNNINGTQQKNNTTVKNEVITENQQSLSKPIGENEPLSQTPSTISEKPIQTGTQNTITYEYNNRYYYKQLDEYAKVIYDEVTNNIENIKSGNYTISINKDFSSLLNTQGGQEKLKQSYDDAINAINLDIPNLFYIDLSKMYLSIESTTTIFGTKYKLYMDTGDLATYYSTGFSSKSQVETAISQVENVKSQILSKANGDEYSKARITHDWLINNMTYESSSTNKGNIYGAFIEHNVVCEGYARAYKYLLDGLGITNILVTGKATNSTGVTEEHMWNYIQIDDMWYAVDVTWDDPIIKGVGTLTQETQHKYFLIGSNELYKTHKERNTISLSEKKITLPTLSNSKY